MDFNRVDGVTGTIRVKGIGSEQSRRNRDQQQARDEEQREESTEQETVKDRVSIAALNQVEDLLPPTRVVRVEDKPAADEAEHPHFDTTA